MPVVTVRQMAVKFRVVSTSSTRLHKASDHHQLTPLYDWHLSGYQLHLSRLHRRQRLSRARAVSGEPVMWLLAGNKHRPAAISP